MHFSISVAIQLTSHPLRKETFKSMRHRKISNTLNDYFCIIGQALADEIDQSPNPLLVGDYLINEGNKTMKFTKISEQDIRDAIDKTKTSKGFGNDNISS